MQFIKISFIIIFFIPAFCNAQTFLDMSYGLDAYNWTRNYKTDVNRQISTGNILLNPCIGLAATYSRDDDFFYSIGLEGMYAPTSLNIGKDKALGVFSLPITLCYRNQDSHFIGYHFKIGYQYNWMDLHNINNSLDKSNFKFTTYVFEFGSGIGEGSYYFCIFFRVGFNLNESRNLSFGFRNHLGRLSELQKPELWF